MTLILAAFGLMGVTFSKLGALPKKQVLVPGDPITTDGGDPITTDGGDPVITG